MTIVHSQILTSAGSDAFSEADALLDKERASLPPKKKSHICDRRSALVESIRTAQRKQSDGRVPNNHRCRRCCNNLSRQHRSLPTVTNSNCSKLYTQATLWLKHTNPTSDFTDILCVAELQQTKKLVGF